jgi:hypothetical protein
VKTVHLALTPDAGHTVSMFGALRTAGLIDYPRPGQVVARAVLFLEEGAGRT